MCDAASKPCTKCCEPIPLGATRCPRCQSWQSPRAYLIGEAQAEFGLIFVPIAPIPMFGIWPPQGADFAASRDRVEVLDSQLRVQDKGYSSDLVTVGRLRNSSPIKWTEVCFEVQYFDAAGKLIGVKSEKDQATVLLPGGEHALQISTMAGAPKEQYASEKVFVRDASEVRRWP